jgi:hypothetical protein
MNISLKDKLSMIAPTSTNKLPLLVYLFWLVLVTILLGNLYFIDSDIRQREQLADSPLLTLDSRLQTLELKLESLSLALQQNSLKNTPCDFSKLAASLSSDVMQLKEKLAALELSKETQEYFISEDEMLEPGQDEIMADSLQGKLEKLSEKLETQRHAPEKEAKLNWVFYNDPELEFIELDSVDCRGSVCRLDIRSTDDAALFEFIVASDVIPELGRNAIVQRKQISDSSDIAATVYLFENGLQELKYLE